MKEPSSMVSSMYWAQRLYNEATRDLLLFPHEKRPAPSRWKRLSWRISDYAGRVHDAWLVLTGRAEIYSED